MKPLKPDYRQRIYKNYGSLQARPGGAALTVRDYQAWASSAQKRFEGWLPADHSAPVLDMGCGSGNFLYFLQHQGYTDLTGVDLSPEQVQMARQWCPGAAILQGDIRSFLEQNPSRFGMISGLDLIEHFPKDEILSFLELIFRSLRPCGRLILQTPNAASPWVGSVGYSDFTHEWFFSPVGLERLLNLVGFIDYQARECGPHGHGIQSLLRFLLWQFFRAGLWLFDLVETGGDIGKIYTRVFVAIALKPSEQ